MNTEVFPLVVEYPIPAPVRVLDSTSVRCQIFSSDKDLSDMFLLHTLGSGKENPIIFFYLSVTLVP